MKNVKYFLFPHGIFWLMMVVYLFIAPIIFSSYILKQGKPIEVNSALPEFILNNVKFNVEKLEIYRNNGEELYSLSGWAFLAMEGNSKHFILDKLVLQSSDSKLYYFDVGLLYRPDIETRFKELERDIKFSGFSSTISRAALKQGKYRIILLFKESNGNSKLTFLTDRALLRTPNQFTLGMDKSHQVPLKIIPTETGNLIFSVDGLNRIQNNPSNTYILWGWSLPKDQTNQFPQIKYESSIVLMSDTENFIVPAVSILRKDVAQAFSKKRNDAENSGYNAFISWDDLKQDKYRIGISLKDPITNESYFVKTDKEIIRKGNHPVLQKIP